MAGAVVFIALAILNCGGYRYGAADQAFYIPAILEHQDPSLFPRDRSLIDPQSRLTLFDDAAAWVVRVTGIGLPAIFFIAYLAGLALLVGAYAALGALVFRSPWSVAALGLALTFRHRISKTGVNTLEGYLHPRMLAFAIGVWAIVCFLRKQTVGAIALVAIAVLFHPTTAAWFAVFLGVALVASEPSFRRPALVGAGAGALAILWLLFRGSLGESFTFMDDRWIAAFAGKDYVFPSGWPLSAWVTNGAYPIALLTIYGWRRRLGLLLPRESALVAGGLALAALFLLSLPLVGWRIALAVQLQIPRVFWILDLLVTIYVVWLLCEAPFGTRIETRRVVTIALLAVLALSRGLYVTFVEHRGRAVLQLDLPHDEWQDVMTWAAQTPADTHLLVDPGHAWRYGTSARVASARDVYLEEVKDSAMALYSRDIAGRVVQRIQDLGDFTALTAASAQALAAKYDFDYVITDRRLDLPVAYRNQRFTAYSLRRLKSSSPPL